MECQLYAGNSIHFRNENMKISRICPPPPPDFWIIQNALPFPLTTSVSVLVEFSLTSTQLLISNIAMKVITMSADGLAYSITSIICVFWEDFAKKATCFGIPSNLNLTPDHQSCLHYLSWLLVHLLKKSSHGDVMTCTYFQRYWPFVDYRLPLQFYWVCYNWLWMYLSVKLSIKFVCCTSLYFYTYIYVFVYME